MQNNSICKVLDLKKSYISGKQKIEVLKGISLSIPPNSFSVLSGSSGSGKTTLLNILSLIDKPDSGNVLFKDNNFSFGNEKQMTSIRKAFLGIIFQEFNLIPIFNVYENIQYVFLGSKITYSERKEKINKVLEETGIAEYATRFPYELSGGQRQRVAIARGLVHNPELVLADEPTANLDSKNRTIILELMRSLQKERGISFFIVSHDKSFISSSDCHWEMKDGKIFSEDETSND